MNSYDTNSATYQEAYHRAMKRVNLRMRLFRHIFSYITVSAILITIYFLTSFDGNWGFSWSDRPWFLWPVGILGILLVIDIVKLVVYENAVIDEKKMIADEMRRMGTAPTYSEYRPEYTEQRQ